MGFYTVLQAMVSLLPTAFLCFYTYKKDKVDKEPLWLLALLFFAGVVIYFPAYFTHDFIVGFFDNLFSERMKYTNEGLVIYADTVSMLAHRFLCSFIGFALIKEIFKWAALIIITVKTKHFNCLFDGIIYSVFLSLGFSVSDNIVFAWPESWDMLLLRSLDALPVHLFFGLISGLFYTMWFTYKSA
nr:PrsW family intramembrane metalloprotease [Clostridiales bacterium]